MSAHDLDGIHAAMGRLERRQRALIVGWVVTVVVCGVLLAVHRAHGDPQVIEAHRIKVTDAQGRQTILIGMNDAGLPGIWLYRPGAKEWSLHVGVSGPAPVVALRSAGGEAELGFANELPGLWYRDASGARRVTIDFQGRNPEIVLYDETKKIMWRTP
jgi:hypothetical protein